MCVCIYIYIYININGFFFGFFYLMGKNERKQQGFSLKWNIFILLSGSEKDKKDSYKRLFLIVPKMGCVLFLKKKKISVQNILAEEQRKAILKSDKFLSWFEPLKASFGMNDECVATYN